MLDRVLLLAVAFASLVAFVLAWIDKRRAARGERRIREATLLTWSVFGGSPGLLAGMLLLRHKVRKATFLVRLLLVVLAQFGVTWLVVLGE